MAAHTPLNSINIFHLGVISRAEPHHAQIRQNTENVRDYNWASQNFKG